MNAQTRQRLLSLSTTFYRAHAESFDASRGHHPWPGWQRLLEWLPDPEARADSDAAPRPLSVLDVGCGNARLARFLSEAGHSLRYVGVDANAQLLEAGRSRLGPELEGQTELLEVDFLASTSPGDSLPEGPFDLVALFGVLHHVPGRDWRSDLTSALAKRVESGGLLALVAWQFAGRERFARRSVPWSELEGAPGEQIDPGELEEGDCLLRFGSDPSLPPRYCHQVSEQEFDGVAEDLETRGLEFETLGDYRADGAEGDLNRYLILRRR